MEFVAIQEICDPRDVIQKSLIVVYYASGAAAGRTTPKDVVENIESQIFMYNIPNPHIKA